MKGFNDVVQKAGREDDQFYVDRGVAVHKLEVVRFQCNDKRTEDVLQEIIQETTNRINRLQQQDSKNEIQSAEMKGRIEVEKQRSALITAEAENERKRATAKGESQGL